MVLSGFALAQPLFDLLGKNAAFFVAHGSTALDVVVFALLVTLVPAAVILGVELVAGLVDPRLAKALSHPMRTRILTILKVLVSYPGGFASLADVKRDHLHVDAGNDSGEASARLLVSTGRFPGRVSCVRGRARLGTGRTCRK